VVEMEIVMTKRKRFWILCFSGIAVAAMIFLSAGLSDLEFLPGQPFSLERGGQLQQGVPGSLPGGEPLMNLVRVFFALALLCLPLLVVYFIVSSDFRKRVLRILVSLLWIYALGVIFARLRLDPIRLGGEGNSRLSQGQGPAPAPVADFVNNPPQWLTVAATLVLSALLVGLFLVVARFIWRLGHRSSPTPLERLAQPALNALESLQAGGDLRNTVMRCYFEMVRVLDEQRGIKRQMDVTPREFEKRLEEMGLSGEPVRQLTRLFEAVRYGAKDVGEDEERRAIACLTAIVEECRSSL
jgi:hypothetical protein